MPVDPKHTALVLIEYQNDFTSEGGALHGAVQGVMEQTGMLANTAALIKVARASGATIVHAPITFKAGYGEISGIRTGSSRASSTRPRSCRASGAPRSSPMSHPSRATSSSRASAALTRSRRPTSISSCARGITTIALGGFLTNCCVESTMRTGYEKGFHVITLSDCVAATSPEEQEAALTFNYPMFSEVMTSEQLLGELGAVPAAAG